MRAMSLPSSLRSTSVWAACAVAAMTVAVAGCKGGGGGEGGGESSTTGADTTTTGTTTDADTTTTTTNATMDETSMTTMVMTTTPNPECGNGVIEEPEQCDDGNLMGGDACDADCTSIIDTTQWSDIIGGMAEVEEAGQGVAVDSMNNIIVVGYIVDALGDPDIWVRKYDPAGTEIWTMVLDPSMGLDDRGFGVDVDASDNIIVGGDIGVGQTSSDIYVTKLDPAGTELWSVTVDGPDSQNDIAEDVAVDADGNVWAVGSVRVDMNDSNIWVGKYSPDGDELFTDVVAGPATLEDRAMGVDVDADGNAFVGGYVSDVEFARDVWLRKYAPDGTEAWTVVWDSPNMGADQGFDVAVAPDGSVGVAGLTPLTAINEDVWLGRFANEDGVLIWQKKFGGPAILNDRGLGLATDSQNAFIVCGFKGLTGTDTDIWVRKWDDGGNVVWTQSFAGPGGDEDLALAVAVDGNDDIAVTGEIRQMENNNGDIWVAKLAAQ